ncbi:hypothetical protein B0H11DRAFT_2216255 [Mycena galericulata]|nr:hypothetical protein B0H11DRAFT_2216255 [Mycena galericulata]
MSSSASASSSKQAETKVAEKPKEAHQAQLGVLEEDDEFEEFPVAGSFISLLCDPHSRTFSRTQTGTTRRQTLRTLAARRQGAAKSGGDKLWEDNWDDDDIEDEFSVQLRNELTKTSKGGDAMEH